MFRFYIIIILNAILLLSFSKTGRCQNALTLENALDIAFKNSPTIKQVQLSMERSEQMLKAKNASLKSQFSLQLTPYTYTKERTFDRFYSVWNTSELKRSSGMFSIAQPLVWTDGTLQLINRFSWQEAYSEFSSSQLSQRQNRTSYDNNLYVSLSQPIFTYNRTKLDLKELKLDLENTSLNYAIQKLTLERQVTQDFYNVFLVKMSLAIAEEELKNQEISHEIIKNKVDAGLAAKEELYQAELNLLSSRSTVQNRQVTLQNAFDNFKVLIGVDIADEIDVIANIEQLEITVDLDRAIEYGLKNRLELRQREIDIENSLFSLIQTSAMNEFKGNVELSFGLIGTNTEVDRIFDDQEQNQRVSLSMEIPLFDWGEKKARIKAAEANISSSRISANDERNTILIGIREAYRQLNNQVTQIAIANQNVRNAKLTYEINLERYQNGDLTSMDLSLYQNQLSQKKIDQIQAMIDYKLTLLNLKIQSLWDFEKNRPVLPEVNQVEK